MPARIRTCSGRSRAAGAAASAWSRAYVSESDYFQRNWQDAYWGRHYARLARVKREVDPDGLFFVHHGVGSEGWSRDGFTRLQR